MCVWDIKHPTDPLPACKERNVSALPSSCDLVRVCFLFFLQRLRTQREEVKLAAQFAGLKIRLYCIFSASPPTPLVH